MTPLTAVTAALAAGLFAAPAPANPTTPAAATDAGQPLLSIAVDNGRTSVAAGEQLTYKIKIRNLGSADAKQLTITQTLPTGLTLVSADSQGKADASRIDWLIDLAPGQESTLTTTAKVGQTPNDLLRLATVACAAAGTGTKPLVCATHSDLLPAGAATTAAATTSHRGVWYIVGAATLALAVAAMVLARRRLRDLVARLRRSISAAAPAE